MNTPPSPTWSGTASDGSAVQIGALVPLTRPGWVEAGRHLLAGLELAVREVNDAGGIAGRPLELVVRDTAADPQRAAAAVDELARLGVAALAGEYHSVVARAAAARADALGLPFLCSSAVLDALTEEPTEWVARLAPAQSHGWQIYADFLLGAGHTPHRRSHRAERLLGVWGPHPAGLPRSTRRHRHRTRHARARPRGRVRRARRQPRDSPPAAGRLPGAGRVDRQVRPPRPAPRRDHDRRSGRATGVRRMGDAAGRRRRRDPVPALPARAPQPARCTSRDGPARAARPKRPPSSPSRATTRSPSSPRCCARTARTGRASPNPGRALPSRAPAGRSSSPARPASASGNGPGRPSRSSIGIRQNPIASGSSTPPDRARKSRLPRSVIAASLHCRAPPARPVRQPGPSASPAWSRLAPPRWSLAPLQTHKHLQSRYPRIRPARILLSDAAGMPITLIVTAPRT